MPARKVTCPKCGDAFGVLERQLGTTVYCPHCGKGLKLAPAHRRQQSVQEEAAAQIYGPPEDEERGEAEDSPRSEREAGVRAMESAFGGASPPKKPSGGRARQEPSGAGTGQGGGSRLMDHLEAGRHRAEQSQLTRTPVRSKSAVWVWVTLLVLVLGVLITWIAFRVRDWGAARQVQKPYMLTNWDDPLPRAPRRPGSSNQSTQAAGAAADREGRGEEPEPTEEMPEGDRPTAEPVPEPHPLTFHRVADTIYHETPKQREVLIGYVENRTDRMVRRSALTLTALGADSGTRHGEETFFFCDVEAEERVYVPFEYRFVSESGTRFNVKWQQWKTDTPPYDLDLMIRKIRPTGARSGHVVCEITNATEYKADVVDVVLIFFDRTDGLSGYTRGRFHDFDPSEVREVRVRWENWESEFVEYAKGRAQIGIDEEARGDSEDAEEVSVE